MSVETAKRHLKKWGADHRVLEFDASSATVSEAAAALGCKPQKIAKTMSFLVKEQPILVVMAGDAKVDNAKYKARFGAKAAMIDAKRVQEVTGHPVGGVCPFGVPEDVRVYLDISLKRFETVFPACGSANSAIELTPSELEQYSTCDEWVDVAKGWRE